jgi:acetylornithine deacetylase/succinyl-diaminopimelate desuccinylase-like protein
MPDQPCPPSRPALRSVLVRHARQRRPFAAASISAALATALLLSSPLPAQTPGASAAKAAASAAFAAKAARDLGRAIYRELVEIDTSQSAGDTLRASQAMAQHLLGAGFPEADVRVFATAPKRGNLVARLRGSGARKPLLLLAHTDVVEAKREDWSTDPFELVEKDGYFYARGTSDDKYMAATFITNLIRYRREGYRPDRDIIVALTADEEIADEHRYGINWLLDKQRPLIDAELALNEGGGVGVIDGKPAWNSLQTTEKLYQTFYLEVRDGGGHSSQPRAGNAIYTLAAGLTRLERFAFPVRLNRTTRVYFERMSSIERGPLAKDMRAILADKPDPGAIERLSARPPYNAQLRTTCVATELVAGHAENALPQLARATVNCRIVPGETVESVQATLERVLANPLIQLSLAPRDTPSSPSALNPELLATIAKVSARFWPGIPVLPTMSAGATDSRFLRNAGIPTYGHSGLAQDIFDVRAHGKDERVMVKAFDEGQRYLYELVKALAGGQ